MFNANAQEFLKELRKQLRQKTYRPRPVRRAPIPKPGSGTRHLGIPCIRDRIVQQALKLVLEPIFESKFSKHSHDFRPGKGCATARKTADWAVAHRYDWVVDLDLKDFFETVNHDLLIDAVNEEVADGSVLRLIRKILKSGIVLPTGEAEQALEAARLVLALEWKLTLHPTKTQVVSLGQALIFLGFRYFRDGNGRRHKIVREKSIKGFRDRIRQHTPRHPQQRQPKKKRMTLARLQKNQRVREMIRRVNGYLKGWHWHFKHLRTSWDVFEGMDGFVRRRVRCAIAGRYAHGRWHQVLNNELLSALGLLSLKGLQRQYQLGLLQAPHTRNSRSSTCNRGGSRMR